MDPVIETRRLRLSTPEPGDDSFMLTLLNTPGWLTYIGDRNVHSPEEARAYIDRINQNPAVTYWVIRLKDSLTPVGVISLIQRDYLPHRDLGFALLPDYNGQGYAQEAASAVLAWLAQTSPKAPLLAISLPQNTASIRLLTRLGFRYLRLIRPAEEDLAVYTTDPDPPTP